MTTKEEKKQLEAYKAKIIPINFKPKKWVKFPEWPDRNEILKKFILDAVYEEFRNKEKFKDFYFVPENEFKELLEIKEAIMDLAHIIGPMIPEGSKLEQIVYKWSKEK